jgi:Bacterial SH3 domain
VRGSTKAWIVLLVLSLSGTACSADDTGDLARRSSAIPTTVSARVTGVGASGLRVREKPTTASAQIGTLAEGEVVEIDCLIDGETVDGNPVWAHVEAKGGYVSDAYLDGPRGFDKGAPRCGEDQPPKPAPDGGGVTTPVDIDGPPVQPHVQVFANEACAAQGACEISTYEGHSPSADLALDLLTSDKYGQVPSDGHAFGDRLAAFAVDNQAKYRIEYVIYRQRINMGEGWRAMEDRGSITQNHFDHVHVTFLP